VNVLNFSTFPPAAHRALANLMDKPHLQQALRTREYLPIMLSAGIFGAVSWISNQSVGCQIDCETCQLY